jgi:hypothetical protein
MGETTMAWTNILRVPFIFIFLSGCALDPYHLSGTDQIVGLGPRIPSVVKSLRCEIVTFFVENKLRSQLWLEATKALKAERVAKQSKYYQDIETLRQYPFELHPVRLTPA